VIDDMFVINPVAHAYNLEPANMKSRYGEAVRDALWAFHAAWSPPDAVMTHEEFTSDWTVDAMAQALFVESDVDLATTHTLRLDSYFHDGLCAREKTVEAIQKYPDRFFAYVGVDPTAGLETCLRELDEQMEELPQAIGLKMYPSQVEPFRAWRLDDETLAFPIIERAIEHGLKTIAIHKAAPLGPVPMNPYRIDDLDGAAGRFPEISFEIIHAGMAFTHETAMALGRYPNVYANLELTNYFLVKAPKLFEEIISEFMMWGGPDKTLFSDGTMFVHTQAFLEAFMGFEFKDETLAGLGIPQITREDKEKILGLNYARMIDLDIEAAKKKIAGDEFDVARRQGRPAPYSAWKAEFATDPAGFRREADPVAAA
jgi:predicted TIM-barrel fold metal-dependent hydrolase